MAIEADKATGKAPEREPRRVPGQGGKTVGTKKILMIDDDQDFREVTGAVLEANGFEFVGASSGEEGLAKLPEVRPDAVILDVMMEDETAGFRVLNAIRMAEDASPLAEFKEVPLVMLTGAQQKLKVELERKAGSPLLPTDAFLAKPVEPAQLVETLNRILAD